jgi:hypothetical protein
MSEANYALNKKLEILETENIMLRKKMHHSLNAQDSSAYTPSR